MIPQDCFDKIKHYFKGDTDKTWVWFQTKNPNLGGVAPLDMIKQGKAEKLRQMINSMMRGFR